MLWIFLKEKELPLEVCWIKPFLSGLDQIPILWAGTAGMGPGLHNKQMCCHVSLRPTATATDPPPTISRTMHSWTVSKDPKIYLFFTISEPKWQIQIPLPFHYFYVGTLFVKFFFDLWPLWIGVIRLKKIYIM